GRDDGHGGGVPGRARRGVLEGPGGARARAARRPALRAEDEGGGARRALPGLAGGGGARAERAARVNGGAHACFPLRRRGDRAMTEGTFAGAGGVPIHWERSAPAGAPRGVVLLAHGYAEHVGRYRDFIAHLTARGLGVAAIDHRGHGRSGGPRGHCRDYGEFIADLHTLAGMVEEWWPGVPRLLFGHSMGGLLGFLYLLRHPDTVRAGALSRPAFQVADS